MGNVTENNKLIAKFMGLYGITQPIKITVTIGETKNYPFELKYHESWDWLMPVAKKISKLDSKNDLNGFVPFCGSMYCYLDKGIGLLYSMCVRHIKTYNENKN